MHGLSTGRWGAEPSVTDHLDLCLGCRACETACPSGVQYGRILERTRAALAHIRPRPRNGWEQFLVQNLLWRGRLLARLVVGYRVARAWRLARALGRVPILPGVWRRMLVLAPRVETPLKGREKPGSVSPPVEKPKLVLLKGCMARALFPRTEEAMADLLERAGYAVTLGEEPDCCGALAHHLGERGLAQRLGRALMDALPDDAGIVTTAAGCGAHVKGLHHLFAGEPEEAAAKRVSARIRDLSESLETGPAPLEFEPGSGETVAYQDACHLRHAQGVVESPRRLLAAAGARVVQLPEDEMCCGSAGTYNLARSKMAERLGKRKARILRESGASVVVTSNPGCLVQLDAYLPERVQVRSLASYLVSRLAC
jgi:glycolate oxidase iron-sulfur subunit